MKRMSPWDVAGVAVRPLTVRERIALSDALANDRAAATAADAAACGYAKDEALREVRAARDAARLPSALVLDAFNVDGAMRVLNVACGPEGADLLAQRVSIDEISIAAVEALGVDVDAYRESSGKAQGQS